MSNGWCRVFRTWDLTKARSGRHRLAQWVEHQTDNLAVAGSTPVPTPQAANLHQTLKAFEQSPREADDRSIGRVNRRVVASAKRAVARQHEPRLCSAWIPRSRSAASDDADARDRMLRALACTNASSNQSNDAAIATAQAALRIGTCDRRSTPPPKGVFSTNVNRFERSVFNFL